MSQETVVLAYSGGLDTSCILKWLKLKDFRVVAYIADVGQEEDFEQVRRNAEMTGADEVVVVDCKEDFVKDYIFPASLETRFTKTGTCWEHRWPGPSSQRQIGIARDTTPAT